MLILNYDIAVGQKVHEQKITEGTNQITISPYTNIVSYEQTCYMKLIYSGTEPVYNPADLAYYFTCHKLKNISAYKKGRKFQLKKPKYNQ